MAEWFHDRNTLKEDHYLTLVDVIELEVAFFLMRLFAGY